MSHYIHTEVTKSQTIASCFHLRPPMGNFAWFILIMHMKPDNGWTVSTVWPFLSPPQCSSRQLHILDPLALPQRGCRVDCQWYDSYPLFHWPLSFALCLWTNNCCPLKTKVKSISWHLLTRSLSPTGAFLQNGHLCFYLQNLRLDSFWIGLFSILQHIDLITANEFVMCHST